MGGMAAAVDSWHLLLCLGLAGASVSICQPAGSAAIVQHVPAGRRGLAFGLQQSAIPGAGLLAGLAVPVLGATIGWRWAFVAGALLGALLGALTALSLPGVRTTAAPASITAAERVAGLRSSYRWLVVLAAAAALGSATGNSLGMFVTSGSVTAGLSVTQAGLLLAAGSASAIAGRINAGVLAERSKRGALPIAIAMLLLGAVGFGLMSFGHPLIYVEGVMLAFSGGWAWQSAFLFGVV